MATHSSILAWRIPWTEEPGGLQSMGLQRVGHNWATNTTALVPLRCCVVFAVQQSESATHIHIFPPSWFPSHLGHNFSFLCTFYWLNFLKHGSTLKTTATQKNVSKGITWIGFLIILTENVSWELRLFKNPHNTLHKPLAATYTDILPCAVCQLEGNWNHILHFWLEGVQNHNKLF